MAQGLTIDDRRLMLRPCHMSNMRANHTAEKRESRYASSFVVWVHTSYDALGGTSWQ